MKQLAIHAGTPKTATSTLQRCLFENREWLKEQGILYPTQRRKMRLVSHHHGFARSFAKDQRKAKAFLRKIERAKFERATISSEIIYLGAVGRRLYDGSGDYWSDRFRYLDRLEVATRDFYRSIVLVFRQPDEFAESLYSTAIRQDAVRMSFPEFREHIVHLLDYDKQTAAFQERFENVRTLRYAEVRSDIVGNILEALSLPVPERRPNDRNVSPDPHAVLWLAERLNDNPTRKQRQRMREFIESDACSRLFSGRSTLWENAGARAAYCARFGWAGAECQTLPAARLETGVGKSLDAAFDANHRRFLRW